jgi:hypothetical protein
MTQANNNFDENSSIANSTQGYPGGHLDTFNDSKLQDFQDTELISQKNRFNTNFEVTAVDMMSSISPKFH